MTPAFMFWIGVIVGMNVTVALSCILIGWGRSNRRRAL